MIRLYNHNIWGNTTQPIGERNRRIAGLVREAAPDFIALQECNPSTSRVGDDPMQELIADAYAEASPENAGHNFTPVFYKKDAWRCIDAGHEPFRGLNDAGSKSITWAVLEEMATEKRVCVVSTHFWYKETAEEDFRQRLENVLQLTDVCERVYARYEVPILVSGDCNNGKNAPTGEAPYFAMLQAGFVDVRRAAEETTDAHTVHGYPIHLGEGRFFGGDEPTFTLDYIFTYADHLQARRFAVVATPDALAASDHCPLIGDFDF